MQKRLKVLLVFDTPFTAKRGHDFSEEFKEEDWSAESHVYNALKQLGHEVRLLGLNKDVKPLIEEAADFRPNVIFNLVEVFRGRAYLEKNFASLLELLEIPFTGTSPSGLFLCNCDALSDTFSLGMK